MKTQIIKTAEILGREVQVYGTFEQPLFLAKDVAEWLGISNYRDMIANIDSCERGVVLTDTPGGIQPLTALTEDGLYEVLMLSRKPQAKEFKKGVKQILYELRTKGSIDLTNPDTIIAIAQDWKREKERAERLQHENELKQCQLTHQNLQLRLAAPKVEYHDQVLNSPNTYTSTTVAKELGMGAPTLHKILKKMAVAYKIDNHWVLYERYQNKGYTKTRTMVYTDASGKPMTAMSTVWTEAGREFVHKIMRNRTTLDIPLRINPNQNRRESGQASN